MTIKDSQPVSYSRTTRTSTFLVRVALTIAILAYLFSKIGLRPAVSGFLSARKEYVIVAFVLVMVMQAVTAHRLKLLIEGQGIPISTFEMVKINLASSFYASFLPGGNITGMAIRFYKISHTTRMYTAVIVSLLIDRLLATLSLCGVGLTLWIFDPSVAPGPSLLLLLLSTMVLTVICVLPWCPPARKRLKRVLSANWCTRGSSFFQKAMDAIEVFPKLSSRSMFRLLALSLLAQLLGVASYYLLARALGLGIPLLTIGWIRSVVVLVTMIPVSVSGIGVREVSLVTLFSPYGVSGSDALGYSFLVFGITVLVVGLVGGLIDCMQWLFPRDA